MDISTLTEPHYSNWGYGLLGAIVNVLLSKRDGEPIDYYKASATLISGCVFAGTGGSVGGMMGMGSVSLGLSAFFAGMVGVNIAKRVMNRSSKLIGDEK